MLVFAVNIFYKKKLKHRSDFDSVSLLFYFLISRSPSQPSFSLLIQILKFWIVHLWTKDSFSKISSLFLFKINNTTMFFFFFCSFFFPKKINKKGNYFATLHLVAEKIKKKSHIKSLIFSMECLVAKKTKRKGSLKNKSFSPPQRKLPSTTKQTLNSWYTCQPNPNPVSLYLHTEIERWERKQIHHPSSARFK